MAEACEALGVPVVGGNVSLYNEAPAGPIFPTPVVGMVGRLPSAARAGRLGFVAEGDAVALVGAFAPLLAGSELAKLRGDEPSGPLPATDVTAIRKAHEAVRYGVRSGALRSAHDIAEGGLAVALAECCIAGGIGATIELPEDLDVFGEAPGRAFVVSGSEAALAGSRIIGRVGGDRLHVVAGTTEMHVTLSELRAAWADGIAGFL
jgi:phosphoribosylformylglycinamidine synthase